MIINQLHHDLVIQITFLGIFLFLTNLYADMGLQVIQSIEFVTRILGKFIIQISKDPLLYPLDFDPELNLFTGQNGIWEIRLKINLKGCLHTGLQTDQPGLEFLSVLPGTNVNRVIFLLNLFYEFTFVIALKIYYSQIVQPNTAIIHGTEGSHLLLHL